MTNFQSNKLKEIMENMREASEIFRTVEEITESFNGKNAPMVLGIVTALIAKVAHSTAPDTTTAKALMFEVMIRASGLAEAMFNVDDDEDEEDEDEEKPLQ